MARAGRIHGRDDRKIKRLLELSKDVIMDCSMDNGGIVAANSTLEYYPQAAKNYLYVWPRDASFACIASDVLGIKEIQENFFGWCLERAEGFNEKGLFYGRYHPNGLKASGNLQPDQTGTVLFALWHHYRDDLDRALEFQSLIENAAEGICRVWEADHFTEVVNDLWEERFCFPDLKENFSYSLSACIGGLECADKLIPNRRWVETASEMRDRLNKHFIGYFTRSYGDLTDNRIDASILGLVYPFQIYDANDPKIISSIEEIEKKLVLEGGVHRYENDEYDGWMYHTMHRRKGGGAWPILNFWMSIYHSIRGDRKNASRYYNWVLERTGEYIPEQIFENKLQVSISPLLWSHSMFILASKHLDVI